MLPEMHIPDVNSFEAIVERTKQKTQDKKPRAALVSPTSPDTVAAFVKAALAGLLEPIVIGNTDTVTEMLAAHNFELDKNRLINTIDATDSVACAADMIDTGRIDALVQGGVRPAPFLTALFDHNRKFRSAKTIVSHVAVMRPQKYPKLIFLTDSAVVVTPTLEQKIGLIANLVKVTKAVGVEAPRLAVLAAVEAVYPQMQATLDGAVLAKMCERGQIKGAQIDGPLSFDIAVDMFAAHAKGVKSSAVAGQADAMLAPNIEVANGIYNAMSLYAHAEIGGVLVGGRVPVAMHSRADSTDARFNSIVLAALMATQ